MSLTAAARAWAVGRALAAAASASAAPATAAAATTPTTTSVVAAAWASSAASPLARLHAAAAAAATHLSTRRALTTTTTQAPSADGEQPQIPPQPQPQPQAQPRPDLVDRYLSDDVLSKRGRLQARKREAIARFARFEGDVGSPEVQVALATERIRDLAEHFREHKKDHHSRRGLQALLNRRRRLLAYLREADFERFCGVLAALGLERDNYARQRRADSFRTGTVLGGGSGAGGPTERLPRVALSARQAAARRATATEAANRRRRRAGVSGGRKSGGGAGDGQQQRQAAAARASGAPMA